MIRKVEDLTIKLDGWKEKATEREKQLKFSNDSLEEEKSKSSRLELELKDSEKRIQVQLRPWRGGECVGQGRPVWAVSGRA
jgi:hypothetical protein